MTARRSRPCIDREKPGRRKTRKTRRVQAALIEEIGSDAWLKTFMRCDRESRDRESSRSGGSAASLTMLKRHRCFRCGYQRR